MLCQQLHPATCLELADNLKTPRTVTAAGEGRKSLFRRPPGAVSTLSRAASTGGFSSILDGYLEIWGRKLENKLFHKEKKLYQNFFLACFVHFFHLQYFVQSSLSSSVTGRGKETRAAASRTAAHGCSTRARCRRACKSTKESHCGWGQASPTHSPLFPFRTKANRI